MWPIPALLGATLLVLVHADVSHVTQQDQAPVAGTAAFWWANNNSPLKQAYEFYKECSKAGTCLPPVAPQVQVQPQAHSHAAEEECDCAKNKKTKYPVSLSANPFLSGTNAVSGQGQVVDGAANGFLGVQPAKAFATAHPSQGQQQGTQPFPQTHPGQSGQFQSCKQAGHACVAASHCVNGVASKSASYKEAAQYCEVGTEVCCRVPDGPANLSDYVQRKDGAGTSIKFAGSSGLSPGLIQVIEDDAPTSGAGATPLGQSSTPRANLVRRTSDAVSAVTVDYSNANFDSARVSQSSYQAAGYLPPVHEGSPTTPRPYKPIIPGPSVVSPFQPFQPSSPKPFAHVQQEYLPPQQYTPKPTPQYIPPPPPTPARPYIPPPPPTPARPYIPPPPPTPARPYIPPPPPTPARPYIPPPPPTPHRPYVAPPQPPKYVPPPPPPPRPTGGYSYPTPTPPFVTPSRQPYTPAPPQPPQPTGGYTYSRPPPPPPPQPQPTGYTYRPPPPSPQPTGGYTYNRPPPPPPQPQPTGGYTYSRPPPPPSPPKPTGYTYSRPPPPPPPQPQPTGGYTYNRPPPPRPTGGYSYPTPGYQYPQPQPSFVSGSSVHAPSINEYLPPDSGESTHGTGVIVPFPNTPNTQPPEYIPPTQSSVKPAYIPPPLEHSGSSVQPTHLPSCAAALKCVPPQFCNAEGTISATPVSLTPQQELLRAPLTDCQDRATGTVGKCCRDANYVDAWPSANLVNGIDNGQYKEDPTLGQYKPERNRFARSESAEDYFADQSYNQPIFAQQQRQEVCGVRNLDSRPPGPGPIDVDFAEIPWQAMILRDTNRSLLCGGVIVRKNAVLTTASCVHGLDTSDVLIKGGEWKLGIDEEPLPFQIVKVGAIVRHPNFQFGTKQNDLALLMLKENLRFTKNVGSLCLPHGTITVNKCILTGWGKKILQVHLRGAIMRSIDVSPIDSAQCSQALQQRFQEFIPHYAPNTLCGVTNNDHCNVDYGSALACTNGNGQYTLTGIFSWDTGCRSDDQIGAFIQPDVAWIEAITAKPLKELRAIEKQYNAQYQ